MNQPHCVGSIVEVMASKDGQTRMIAGKNRSGYKSLFTLFIIDLIDYTRKQKPDFTSTDVINNIEIYFYNNENVYPGLNIEKLPGDDLLFVDSVWDDLEKKISNYNANPGDMKPDITRRSLVKKINILKKS